MPEWRRVGSDSLAPAAILNVRLHKFKVHFTIWLLAWHF
jgi:hypothetical protein